MRKKWKAWGGWRFVAGLLLAALLLWLAFRQADWKEMLAIARQARWAYLALAVAGTLVSWWGRGLRWRILLGAEKSIPPVTVFWGTAVGYLGNAVLPARAGELLRSVALGQKAQISKSYVLATALTERLIDALVLVVVGFATVQLLGTPAAWLASALKVILALGLGGIVFLFVAPRLENKLVVVLGALPLPAKLKAALVDFTRQFLLGARAFQHPGRALGFAALTAAIWLGDALLAGLMASAFGLTLAIPEALLLISALGLASAAPATPGYVGIYQFVAVTILTPLGFSWNEALTYIITAQAVSYLATFLCGPICLWQLGVLGLSGSGLKPPSLEA